MADPYSPPVPGFMDPPSPRRRWGCFLGVFAVIALLVAAGAWGLAQLTKANRPNEPQKPAFVVPILTPSPRSAIPGAAGAVPSAAELPAWLDRVSSTTDIPVRVLRAYAEAEVKLRSRAPRCRITWATIAGIGRIESMHGTHGGSAIGADGLERPPVIGIPLDGSPGVRAVPDTDHGELDGDSQWDHALGPLQLLPVTWEKYGIRASGDGAGANPQDIDDAALTAGEYLCTKGGNLTTPNGWWTAVLTYNNSVDYAQEVFSNADAYGKANLTPPAPASSR
jgi:hypothetical protein